MKLTATFFLFIAAIFFGCKDDSSSVKHAKTAIEKKFKCSIIEKRGITKLNGKDSPYCNIIFTGLDGLNREEALGIASDASILFYRDLTNKENLGFNELLVSLPYRSGVKIDTVSKLYTIDQLKLRSKLYEPLRISLEGLKYKNYSVVLAKLDDQFKEHKTLDAFKGYLMTQDKKYGAIKQYVITEMIKRTSSKGEPMVAINGVLTRGATNLKQKFYTAAFYKKEKPTYHLIKFDKPVLNTKR